MVANPSTHSINSDPLSLCDTRHPPPTLLYSNGEPSPCLSAQLIDLIDSVKETGRMDFTLTAAQKTAIARLKSVGDVMEASLSAIDEQIALFNDY